MSSAGIAIIGSPRRSLSQAGVGLIGSEPTLAESAALSAGETLPALFGEWTHESRPVITVKWGSRTTSVPDWFLDLAVQSFDLLRLPQNWDSYGAPRIEPAAVEDALSLLADLVQVDMPLPSIVPTAHGGVQVEWHSKEFDFEIELAKGQPAEYFTYERATGDSQEGMVLDEMDRVRAAIARLSAL